MTQTVLPKGALGVWWAEGVRSAVLMRPRWSGLEASPFVLAVLFLVPLALGLLFERLYIPGPASFFWPAMTYGWLGSLLAVWYCWALSRAGQAEGVPTPDAAALFGLLCAQALPLSAGISLLLFPMWQAGMFNPEHAAFQFARMMWIGSLAWVFVAQALLLWRSGTRRPAPRLGSIAVLLLTMVLSQWLVPNRHWYPAPVAQAKEEKEDTDLVWLTQEVAEQQGPLVQRTLQGLAPQRHGKVDVYVLTFSPYANQDVFRNESAMVARVMGERFDAQSRTVQMVNHVETRTELPWATPLNLQRAIQQAARRMDRDEDVLFIHLTSHGARDGQLSANFWPLEVKPVTPKALKSWLDEAGVRYRVISVSACYSGSWVKPLEGEDTMVMTAADAEHTSYGCGSKSDLTYFGRAMYDEQMRSTRSFERAHAAARAVIEKREKEAGKSDGFSNPQISAGEGIRRRLRLLEAQQDGSR